MKMLKKITTAYLAFGAGILVGTIIASVIAGLLLRAALNPDQIRALNEAAEDLKER